MTDEGHTINFFVLPCRVLLVLDLVPDFSELLTLDYRPYYKERE